MSEIRFDSAVVILGSHRASASALAGVLRLCGLSVPRRLVPSSEADGSEVWESDVISSLNGAIFNALSLDWRSLKPISQRMISSDLASGMATRAREALTSQFRLGDVPLIYDPKMCRLLPLWEEALSALSARTAFIFSFGPPVRQAQSVESLDDIDHDQSLALWARYYLDAEAATRGRRRAFISHVELADNWRETIGMLRELLDLPLEVAALDEVAIDQFLLSGSGSVASGRDATFVDQTCFPLLRDAYRIFAGWAQGNAECESELALLDQARAWLDQRGSEMPGLVECGSDRRSQMIEGPDQNARAILRSQLGTIRVRDDEIAKLRDELRATVEELGKVKRKYRSTQAILARERVALKEVRAKLARADTIVSRYRRSFVWIIYSRVTAIRVFLVNLSERVTGKSEPKRYDQMISLLDQSGLFDRDWYLHAYPDVAATGIDPVRHYLENGWREGRDPGPGFSTTAYLKSHADVAAHGVNPLLHYVEYGHSEGRGTPDSSVPTVRSLVHRDVGPSAPCASFAIAAGPAVRWRRAGRFGASSNQYVLHDGLVVGEFSDALQVDVFRASLARLAFLSGANEGVRTGDSTHDEPTGAVLLDAWYAQSNRLRSRWRKTNDKAPIVVRVLQHVGDTLDMIGEGLISDDLDFVDAKLINQFFPLLFVFADVDGRVLGWQPLAFPSLCRGGLHTAEFLALHQSDASAGDVCAVSERFADKLLAIRAGDAAALIARIDVDLRAADGTHVLFQPNFQKWLSVVARVPLIANNSTAKSASLDYLRTSLRTSEDPIRARGVATLILGSDMVPSIAALVAIAEAGEGEPVDLLMPMIVSGGPAGQFPFIAHVPRIEASALESNNAPAFPILSIDLKSKILDEVKAFAVRTAGMRPLSDAELLVPLSPPALSMMKAEAATTWVISPAAWPEQDLLQSLEALGAQNRAGLVSILFVGPAPDAAVALASQLFEARVVTTEGLGSVGAFLNTPLAGVMGPSVIMHDRRTITVLTQLLADPRTASASVALVSIERRGKGILITPTDVGVTESIGHAAEAELLAASVSTMWRSTWSVSAPPADLWLARADQVVRWLDPNQASFEAGIHACSALVTASYCAAPAPWLATIFQPPSQADRAVRLEMLV